MLDSIEQADVRIQSLSIGGHCGVGDGGLRMGNDTVILKGDVDEHGGSNCLRCRRGCSRSSRNAHMACGCGFSGLQRNFNMMLGVGWNVLEHGCSGRRTRTTCRLRGSGNVHWQSWSKVAPLGDGRKVHKHGSGEVRRWRERCNLRGEVRFIMSECFWEQPLV